MKNTFTMDHSTCLVDVTEKFIQAANQLQIGEMIHSDDFSLQRTLTAVLVGDPFFDKTFRLQETCKESENWVPCEKLDDLQLYAFMCQFIAYFTSWLDGQSFSQTVYSCIYLRQLDSLNNMKLKHFLVLAVHACQWIDKCIIEARVVEEEDFVLCRPLLETILWSDMETDYGRAKQFVESSSWKDSDSWNKPLQLLYYLCKLLDNFMSQPLEESVQDIRAAKNILMDISLDKSMDTKIGFDICLQSSQGEIPRNTSPYTFSVAQQRLDYLLTEWKEWIDFTETCAKQIDTCHHLFPMLWNIFSFNRSKRHILTRSLLYHKLYSRSGMLGTNWSLTIWLKNMGWKCWQSPRKDWGVGSLSKVNHLVHRLDYLIQDIIHVLCLNRGRQRRKLLNCLSLVEHLYMQSIWKKETTQTLLGNENHPLSLFIIELGYIITIQHILLGFDCELYDSNEYSAVYFVLGRLYESWSFIRMDSASSFCWKSPQQKQLWDNWIVLCSKLYRASCLLWEWEQQRKQMIETQERNHERDPLSIHSLAYELRFSRMTSCSFMEKVDYEVFYHEIVETVAHSLSYPIIHNTLKYWLEPLQYLCESMKKTLEYLVKEDCFYFMDWNRVSYD